jgi:heavy metal sensor kinase
MTLNFHSIKFKIGAFYLAIIILIVVILIQGIFYFSRYYTALYRNFDVKLKTDTQQIVTTLRSYVDILGNDKRAWQFAMERVIRFEGAHPDAEKIETLQRQWVIDAENIGIKDMYINLCNSKGKLWVSSPNMNARLSKLFTEQVKIGQNRVAFGNASFIDENTNYRVINLPFFLGTANEQYVIQVARPLPTMINLLRNKIYHIGVGIIFVLFVAGFFGRIFVHRFVTPVLEIADTAKNISRENLGARVKVGNTDEETKYLANTFNDMIGRLEESFRYISEFSSHVAHELKTPLAIIRGEAEITLRKDRSAEDYKKALVITLEEAERMLKMIDNLLLLTRIEYKAEAFNFEQINFVDFLYEIYEDSKILAAQKNIAFTLDMKQKKIELRAERLHLRRLFLNLFDNAIKFTPTGGKVDISVKCVLKDVKIFISDTGPGIPPEDLPNIFKRFYRAQKTEQIKVSGHGLGLSIVQSIVKIHQGNIEVESQLKKGTTFTVTLPLA